MFEFEGSIALEAQQIVSHVGPSITKFITLECLMCLIFVNLDCLLC